MAATRRPRSVIKWLSSPRGGAQILRDVFGRGDDLTHELLDTLGSRTVWSLRRTLVDTGILPPRVETIAQLDSRIRATAGAAAHTTDISCSCTAPGGCCGTRSASTGGQADSPVANCAARTAA
jgi:hypothetical protein